MRVPGTSEASADDSTRDSARHATSPAFPWIAVAAAWIVGLALRAPALLQDPWIDEIWSWGLARSRADLADVFAIESSNSHALITAWIWLVGDQPTFVLYRLPSLLAGMASIAIAARIGNRHGRSTARAAAWIFAVSYPAVVFATEARGYAWLVLATLATFESAETWIDTGRRRWLVSTWVWALIGVLAQSLFVIGWAAIALAVVVRLQRAGGPRTVRRILAFVVPPVGAFVAWWFLNVRHVFNAGAPPWDIATIGAEISAWSLGLPLAGWSLFVGGAVALGVFAADLRVLVARRDLTWIVQLCAVVIVPIVTIALLWQEFLALRYFVVPLAFWSLALARVLARLADRGASRRLLAMLFIAAFTIGNTLHTVDFLRAGRGRLSELVADMTARSTSWPIVVTGNYDFNVGAQIEWHKRHAPGGRTFAYVPQSALTTAGADFYWYNQPRFTQAPPAEVRLGTQRYESIGTSIHVGVSGTDWAVYQRVTSAPAVR